PDGDGGRPSSSMASGDNNCVGSSPRENYEDPAERNTGEDSYFECNICLDGVTEPVVTRCGHLFCWPCLYRWLNTNQTECPVCKAGVTATNVIPLYGRGAANVDPRTKSVGHGNVPSRPDAERPRAERPRTPNPFTGGVGMGGGWGGFGASGTGMEAGGVGGTGGHLQFQAGLGFFPSLFGLQFQSFTFLAEHANSRSEERERTAAASAREENTGETMGMRERAGAQQQFLSRLLLVLGSFVVLCLVLF
ncbi:unnamed protein product, partial [Laminaria digitata]